MTKTIEDDVINALSRAARLSFDDGVFSPHDFLNSLSEDGFAVTISIQEKQATDFCEVVK